MYSENQTRSNTVYISLIYTVPLCQMTKNLFEKHNHIKEENIQKLKPDSIKVCVWEGRPYYLWGFWIHIFSKTTISSHPTEILKDELHSIATMGRGGVETTNLVRDIGLKATGSVPVATYIQKGMRRWASRNGAGSEYAGTLPFT